MAVFTSIGAAIFGAGTFAALATAAALQVAAGIAVSLIGQALAGSGASEKPGFGVQGQIQAGGDLPRSFMFGYGATAGSIVYANVWGNAGKTPNAFFTQVICVSDYPVNSLAQVWVNGELCTLGAVAHPTRGYPVVEYNEGGKDHLWIKFYDGAQTVADSFLTDTVSSAERPYDATRVGTGCAYVIATSLVHEGLFTGFPQFKFAISGAKLYDPSRDDTAGGTGSHRWDDRATWGGDGDHLPAVQIYNILRGITYNGEWLYGLQGLNANRLPTADWIAEIEKCRALIAGPDGDEATYRSGGEIRVNAPIADAIESILTACQGRLAEIGGVYKLKLGAPAAPVFSFTDGDIISTDEQSFTPFFGLSNTINGISASYPSPAEGWNSKVAPPLYNAAYEAEDGDRRLLADVRLDLVPYGAQVQRLMKSALAEARRARRHTFVLPPEAFVLEPGDIVEWTSDRNGYAAKSFRVDGISDRANLDVMVDITEVDPSDYDWNQAVDYTAVTDGPLTRGLPAAQVIVDWSVIPATFYDAVGNARRPSMQIAWDGDQDDVEAVAFEVRLASTGVLVYAAQVTDVAAGSAILPAVFLPNTAYEARGIYVPASDRAADWSAWLAVTTPDVRLGSADINIQFDEIAADIAEDLKWISRNVRSAVENFDRLGSLLAEQDIANYNDRQTLRREIEVRAGTLEASFNEIIEVAIGPGGAIATSLESLYAAMGGNTAEVLVRWGAESTPVGVTARWGLQLSTDGDVFGSAAFLAQVRGGVSELLLNADRTVISSDGGTTVNALFEAGTTTVAKARIGDASIETAKIADLAVTAGKIDDLAVTSAKIASAAITEAKIGAAAITSAKIGDLQVSTIKIADAAVTDIDAAVDQNTALSGARSLDVVVDVAEYPVTVGGYAEISKGNSSDTYGVRATLYVIVGGASVELAKEEYFFSGAGSRKMAKLSAVNLPGPPGAYTYRLTYEALYPGTCIYASIAAAVPKK